MKNLILNPNQKVVITFDNNEILARIYENNKVIAKGIAYCSPDDEFDLVLGSTLAMTRAVEELDHKNQKWVKVTRHPMPGDYVRVIYPLFSFDRKGDVMKVSGIENARLCVKAAHHPNVEAMANVGGDYLWHYYRCNVEVVEPAPKEPKFRKITRLPKDGDYAKIIHSVYDFDDPDTFLPIRGVVNGFHSNVGFYVLNKEHPGAMKFDREHPPVEWSPDQAWYYNCNWNTIEFYEKV